MVRPTLQALRLGVLLCSVPTYCAQKSRSQNLGQPPSDILNGDNTIVYDDTELTLESIYNNGTGYHHGVVFQIQAQYFPIRVTSLRFPTVSQDMSSVNVLTLQGEQIEPDLSKWVQLCQLEIEGNRENNVWNIILPAFDFHPVSIEPGAIQTFMVLLDEPSLVTTSPLDASKIGSPAGMNEYLAILVGSVVDDFQGSRIQNMSPGAFNGFVQYDVAHPSSAPSSIPTTSTTKSPTSLPTTQSPTQSPTMAPTVAPRQVKTQMLLRLYRTSSTNKLRELQDRSSNSQNDTDVIQSVSSDFLNQQFNVNSTASGAVKITKIHIADPNYVLSDNSNITLVDDPNQQDYFVEMHGEYKPPPEIDFGHLVEDAYNDKGDQFVGQLKQESPSFEEVSSVGAQQITFTELSMPVRKYPLSMIILILVLTSLGACVVGTITLCVGLKIRAQMKKRIKHSAEAASLAGKLQNNSKKEEDYY